ncbi:Zinc/iron permease [Neurospora hispaniola]|uniref:Zinc/iron permease n=1 Tax=Neurospora hispaniola TaxID=588809 RepID=A0AAJ0I9Y2_9PEZI|nr:Zinc/iron permease [Neurospora hispaniola]
MLTTAIDNDTRGWILTVVSGLACILGSTIICVDVPIRFFNIKSKFSIQGSNVFISGSLSLSFGVMIFSALFSMLPSALRYLTTEGRDEKTAGLINMGCYIAGFFGIQVVSRVLHRFIPSHVVGCDHSHNPHANVQHQPHYDDHHHQPPWASRTHGQSVTTLSSEAPETPTMVEVNGHATESTPLLPTETDHEAQSVPPVRPNLLGRSHTVGRQTRSTSGIQSRRPSVRQMTSRVLSFVKDTKLHCDGDGPCFGYTDPCGQECFRHIGARSIPPGRPATLPVIRSGESVGTGEVPDSLNSPIYQVRSRTCSRESSVGYADRADHDGHDDHHDGENHDTGYSAVEEDIEAQHHHHVPTNAFLSIGLQTVIAIALHKFPEGFITYATNHVNPSLGFNVFMALFVHNIAEGFSMALPLYMALNSRFKAIAWATLLGGLSQPLGAGVAVLWFKVAKHSNITINGTAYGCLFAVTAGIMTSVALQLFGESLSLTHNRNMSIFFAFLGMTLLGVCDAIADV